jgi:IPT/TIG domain
MAVHYEVRGDETALIVGPANIRVSGESVPVMAEVEEPTVDSLSPDTAACGDDDLQMVVTGTGFTEISKIVFNGYDEPTALLSPTQVRTNVKPSLFAVPVALPVQVRNGSKYSNMVDFTFTEAGTRSAPKKGGKK